MEVEYLSTLIDNLKMTTDVFQIYQASRLGNKNSTS